MSFSPPPELPPIDQLMATMAGVDGFALIGARGMPVASKAFDDGASEGAFEAEFARDALVMAAFVDDYLPLLTEATVVRLAQLQGVKDPGALGNPMADFEEIGRIPHEMRLPDDPSRALLTAQHGWTWPYYGSVDATPMFVSALVNAVRRRPALLTETVVQLDGAPRSMTDVLSRAVDWIVARLDAHPDGLLGARIASNGCWQVWADSVDAYHRSDGTLASGMVAAIEVQALTFDALAQSAAFAEEADIRLSHTAPELRARAERLREAAFRNMWIDSKGGFFASGHQVSDEYTGPLDVRTANMAMVLASSMLDAPAYHDYVVALARQVTAPRSTLVSPSGIRTLASDERRFRPDSYHNGSVWPWQNLWIARGLRRHGFTTEADEVEMRVLALIRSLRCYPEYVRGDDDAFALVNHTPTLIKTHDGMGNSLVHGVQPAQKVQGWTVFGVYSVYARRRHEDSVDDVVGSL